jgi:hypothetical protein
MTNRGLSTTAVKRGRFKKRVGVGGSEPITDVRGPRATHRRPTTIQRRDGIEAACVRDPPDAARRDTGKLPGDSVIVLKRRFLCDEETDEFSANISESDEREPIGANGNSLYNRAWTACRTATNPRAGHYRVTDRIVTQAGDTTIQYRNTQRLFLLCRY